MNTKTFWPALILGKTWIFALSVPPTFPLSLLSVVLWSSLMGPTCSPDIPNPIPRSVFKMSENNVPPTSDLLSGAWSTEFYAFNPPPDCSAPHFCFHLSFYSLSSDSPSSPSRDGPPPWTLPISCPSSLPRLCSSPLLDILSIGKMWTSHDVDRHYGGWLLG